MKHTITETREVSSRAANVHKIIKTILFAAYPIAK